MQKITVYSKDYCPYCTLVKNLFTSIGASFEEIDITDTPEAIVELRKKSGMRTVPQVFIGDICVGGYDQTQALHREGKLLPLITL